MTKAEYISKLKKDITFLSTGQYFFDNPWDMECCRIPYRLVKERAVYSPNDDPEWIFSYARLEWLFKYTYLFCETGQRCYVDEWTRIVLSFFKKNNSCKCGTSSLLFRLLNFQSRFIKGYGRIPTYRTLDTAIRNYIILFSLSKFLGDKKTKGVKYIKKRVSHDIEYAYKNLRTPFDDISNWGIIIVSSYCICKLFICDDIKKIENALVKLRFMLEKQVLKSGAHREDATMYHNQVLIFLLRLIYQLRVRGYNEPQFLFEKAKAMALYTITVAGPDAKQIAYGDSDVTDLSTLYIIIKKVLALSVPKGTKELDYMLLSEFDIEYNEIQNEESVESEKELFIAHENGVGVYQSYGTKLIVFNEAFNSGHKHYDNGSFVLFFKYTPLFIDSGRYTYFNQEQRKYFKSSVVHNLAVIDNVPPSTDASFGLNKYESNGVKWFRSTIVDNSRKMKQTRFFVLLSYDTIVIVDKIQCSGLHQNTTQFTPALTADVSILRSGVVQVENPRSGIYNIYSPCFDTVQLVDGYVSPLYNEKQPIKRISMSKDFDDKFFAYFVISGSLDKKNPVSCSDTRNGVVLEYEGNYLCID